MKKQSLISFGLGALALAAACTKNEVRQSTVSADGNSPRLALNYTAGLLIDGSATAETQNLYKHLRTSGQSGVLFGHQDDRVLGIDTGDVEWKYDATHQFNSDVKYMVGEYPAVNGYELGNIEIGSATNDDGVPFKWIAKTARAAYSQGGLISVVWGCRNPVYPNYDKKAHADSGVVNTIAKFFDSSDPNHAQYVATYQGYMDKLAQFIKDSLTVGGVQIPLLFRTLHEQNGGWYWWGATQNNAYNYKKFWQYTVDYLKNTKGLHNLIYVYAPSSFTYTSASDTTNYLATYPGDNYIDVLSADIYDSPGNGAGVFVIKAGTMVQVMKTKAVVASKPYSISETGLILVPDASYWTSVFKPVAKGRGLAYVLVWRNTRNNGIPVGSSGGDSYYCAYRGQVSANNFRLMHQDTALYFLTKAAAKHLYQP